MQKGEPIPTNTTDLEPATNVEHLYDPDRLIQIIEANPRLFKSKNRIQSKLAKLHDLPPKARMPYILKNLTQIKLSVEYLNIPNNLDELADSAYQAVVNAIDVEKRAEKQTVFSTIKENIDYIKMWLKLPIIYDARIDHDDRRKWTDELINLFDLEDKGKYSQGPFSEFFLKNKLSSNYTGGLFLLMLPYSLQALGLDNTEIKNKFNQAANKRGDMVKYNSATGKEKVKTLSEVQKLFIDILKDLDNL